MEVSKLNQKLSAFLESGIFRFEDSNSVFNDPVRVLNQLYTRFMVSPSSYYSRFFESSDETHQQSSTSRKRKRKEKKPYNLNERERAADWRHQEAKPFVLKASQSLQIATDLLGVKLLFNVIQKTSEMKLELRRIVASISLWLTTTAEWKCPPEVEQRCQKEVRKEWYKISHIPNIEFDYRHVQKDGVWIQKDETGHEETSLRDLIRELEELMHQ